MKSFLENVTKEEALVTKERVELKGKNKPLIKSGL